jgi:MazG family protein
MYTLRSEKGCAWDRAQTIQDLRQYLLEEVYEVLHALDQEDTASMKEELGDLLFQVVFLSQVMQECGTFSLLEVLDRLCNKMIGRHPHVFGDTKAGTPEQALASWESMKIREKSEATGGRKSVLDGIPGELPALLQAHMISSKVARVGFDWEKEEDVWKKFHEEADEFSQARSRKEKEEELGDLLFTLVNVARKHQINAEDSLRVANAKFSKRFSALEQEVDDWKKMTLQELDEIWERVKKNQE